MLWQPGTTSSGSTSARFQNNCRSLFFTQVILWGQGYVINAFHHSHVADCVRLMYAGRAEEIQELMRETFAEEARSNQWERMFPCPGDPCRYLDKFEMVKSSTRDVCHALKDSSCRSWLQTPAVTGADPGKAWR